MRLAKSDPLTVGSSDHFELERERELQQILDLTPQHLGVFGPDGSPLYRVALDYFGVNIDQWRAESRIDLVHPDDREHGRPFVESNGFTTRQPQVRQTQLFHEGAATEGRPTVRSVYFKSFFARVFSINPLTHSARASQVPDATANIFLFEEVVARELHLIEIAHRVEEERIAAAHLREPARSQRLISDR